MRRPFSHVHTLPLESRVLPLYRHETPAHLGSLQPGRGGVRGFSLPSLRPPPAHQALSLMLPGGPLGAPRSLNVNRVKEGKNVPEGLP